MKKIIVLTDFSANSINAYRYAVKLACQIKADVLLLFSTNGAPMSLTNQLQYSQQLHSFAKRYACDSRQQNNPHHTECLISNDRWLELLPAMITVHQPDLILAGSDMLALLENAQQSAPLQAFETCPILWIPDNANYQSFQNLVFVTDFTDQEPAVVEQVKNLAQTFRAQVSLVHFYPATDRSRLATIKREGAGLHGVLATTGAPYYLLEEEDMIEGLQDYAERYPVDLFIIATQDTHLTHQYLQPAYRKTQACPTTMPLLNLYQARKKPCAGNCTFCHHADDKNSVLETSL